MLSVSGGTRTASATLEREGDEYAERFAAQVIDGRILGRSSHGTTRAPGLSRLVGGLAELQGEHVEMRQAQLVAVATDQHDDARQVVLLFTATCTAEQLGVIAPELDRWVRSVRPRSGSEQAEDPDQQ